MVSLMNVGYSCFVGLAEVLLEIFFFTELTGKKERNKWMFPFIIASLFIVFLQISSLLKLLCFVCMLVSYGFFVLKAGMAVSVLSAILAAQVQQMCYGILDSVLVVLLPLVYQKNPAFWGNFFMVICDLCALALSYLCYKIIVRCLQYSHHVVESQSGIVLGIPLLLIFAAGSYIIYRVYGNTVSLEQIMAPSITNHIWLFVILILGLFSIFSIVYAYKKLSDDVMLRGKFAILKQQNCFQNQYVLEAKSRYESTKSLRHDMKNHILVIKGLLENNEFERACSYVSEIDTLAEGFSFPFQTNNPVLDILLENKGALAKERGIEMCSTLKVPYPCRVNDTDYCIILSNALDNAIHACEKIKEKKYINISGGIQGDLLLIKIENSFDGDRHFKEDTGLANIRKIAEKHDGTMDISIKENVFCLSVLLVISHHP